MKDTGEKVLLSLMSAGAESTDGWQMLLEDLAARKMGRPRLVMNDGNPGMRAALNRQWPGVAHQRCTVHKLRNLLAKAPKHAHEAVREDYHRIVYAETRDEAQRAHAAFLLKWKKLCPPVAASLEEAGEQLLTFYQFPASQHLSLRTTNIIERMQQEFRRRIKTQAALPNEGAVLRVFFGLWISGQMKLRRIRGYRDLGGTEEAVATSEFHDSSVTKCALSTFLQNSGRYHRAPISQRLEQTPNDRNKLGEATPKAGAGRDLNAGRWRIIIRKCYRAIVRLRNPMGSNGLGHEQKQIKT